MKTLLFLLIPVICISQTIIIGDPDKFTDAGEGDLYIDKDDIIYLGITDGHVLEIGRNGNVWKNTNGGNANSLDTTIGFKKGNVGIGLTNPDNSSILELSSISQGFLLPRMTKDQRDLINDPAEGLIVYCSDCICIGFHYFDGAGWKDFKCESAASFRFDCGSLPKLELEFTLKTAETLNVQMKYTGITSGNVTLNGISSDGFTIASQTIAVIANLTRTINIPVSYNGNGSVGDYTFFLESDSGINNCQVDVSVIAFDGLDETDPAPSCKELLAEFPSLGNGVYWIDPDGLNTGNAPIQCNCDMDNGGWTLLDGFSDKNNVSIYTNAIGNVNISNKAELSNSGYSYNVEKLQVNFNATNLNEYLIFNIPWGNGRITKELPMGFNEVRVLFGINYWSGGVNVLLNGIEVASLPNNSKTFEIYEGVFNPNDQISIEETGSCIGAINSIWVR
ncbi:MAG: hypothetical protein COB98_10290 [Flavobacteriaceae bacterium]|nr:MAG: hypothetical protein COB98_10290 [Flavobacteriaceae bacterium]